MIKNRSRAKKPIFLFWFVFLSLSLLISPFQTNCYAQKRNKKSEKIDRPLLVVGIVVDQMRWDYLYRYYDRYSEGGFKRLLNEGFSYNNTFINYLPSATGVGHSTIFTGSIPSIHGIAGNNWIDRQTGQKWYCVEDTTEETIGSSSEAGQLSPRNLLVSTMTDQLRIVSNFKARTVGISLKDRAAILPVGHTATAAFWFDNASGHFITSTYYMDQLPEWVAGFNNQNLARKLTTGGWESYYPISTYLSSTADDVPWEGRIVGKSAPTFPYKHVNIRQSPHGNTLVTQFAKESITGYQLGQRNTTDFLAINFASTDYVGHKTGINSIETEDTYLRLDKNLATLFRFLDEKIGKENYLLFLTADHGAGHSAGYMKKHNLPTGFWDTNLVRGLNRELHKQIGLKDLVRSDLGVAASYQINYDLEKIANHKLNLGNIKQFTVDYLQKKPGVMYAVDVKRIGETPIPRRIKEMIINGFNRKRSGQVQIIPTPGWMPSYSKKGTTHGGWNPYDTHIPLLFMGWNIPYGRSTEKVHMVDIAPTITNLLNIQMPNGSIGNPLKAITDVDSK